VGAELPVAQSASSPVTLVSVEMHPLIQSPVSVEASPLAKIEAPLADAVSVSLPSSTPAGLATETLDRPFSSNVDTIESEALFPEVSSTPLGSTQSISSAGALR